MGIIEMSAEGFPVPGDHAYQLCINCGYCVDICIHGALGHLVRTRAADSGAAIKRYEELRKRKKEAKEDVT
jgi:ferredoxin